MHPSLFTCYISVRQVQGVHPGRRRQERGRERRRRQVQSEGNREPCDAQRAREVRIHREIAAHTGLRQNAACAQ